MNIVTLTWRLPQQKSQTALDTLSVLQDLLVSVGYKRITDVGVDYLCFHHEKETPTSGGFEQVRSALEWCDLLVGHNIKFDLMWLRECGWSYDWQAMQDTMVGSTSWLVPGVGLEPCRPC